MVITKIITKIVGGSIIVYTFTPFIVGSLIFQGTSANEDAHGTKVFKGKVKK